jgi:hypothetical protein
MPATMGPIIVPFRDENNSTVRYVAMPSSTYQTNMPLHSYSSYDEDDEPLISAGNHYSDLDEDAMMRFTATGRPAPVFKASPLSYLGGDRYSVPQLLPKRYTDDSIIPAIVTNVIPRAKAEGEGEKKKGRFLSKFKGGEKKKDEEKGIVKVVYMPRREYLKYFARDLKGDYIGSEPYRRWTEEELVETFKQYIPKSAGKKKGYRPPS